MKSYINSAQSANQSQQQFNSLPTFVSHQVPPQLPKKTRPKQSIRPIGGGSIVHSSNEIQMRHKRKSAVELLAESKPYYVKSEAVLDRKQQLLYQSGRSSIANKSNPTVLPSSACKLTILSIIFLSKYYLYSNFH